MKYFVPHRYRGLLPVFWPFRAKVPRWHFPGEQAINGCELRTRRLIVGWKSGLHRHFGVDPLYFRKLGCRYTARVSAPTFRQRQALAGLGLPSARLSSRVRVAVKRTSARSRTTTGPIGSRTRESSSRYKTFVMYSPTNRIRSVFLREESTLECAVADDQHHVTGAYDPVGREAGVAAETVS